MVFIIYIIYACLMNDTLVTVFPNWINRTCENHCCVQFINVLRVTRSPFVNSNYITALQLRTCLPLIGYCQVLSAGRKVQEKSYRFNMVVSDNDGHNWNVLLNRLNLILQRYAQHCIFSPCKVIASWWLHQMETFSALLATSHDLCIMDLFNASNFMINRAHIDTA